MLLTGSKFLQLCNHVLEETISPILDSSFIIVVPREFDKETLKEPLGDMKITGIWKKI